MKPKVQLSNVNTSPRRKSKDRASGAKGGKHAHVISGARIDSAMEFICL